jgi:hypothetical protein
MTEEEAYELKEIAVDKLEDIEHTLNTQSNILCIEKIKVRDRKSNLKRIYRLYELAEKEMEEAYEAYKLIKESKNK